MSSSGTLMFSLFLFFLISHTLSQHPTALILPISKHPSTLQYTTRLTQSTLPFPLTLVIDISGPFLWLSCGSTHNSSTFKSVQCHSPHCSLVPHYSIKNNCHKNKTCIVLSKNQFTRKLSAGELSEDILSLQSTDGFNPTSIVSVPRFPFLCVLAQEGNSLGLPTGVEGVAGLGHDRLGLPTQLADAFNFSQKFAMCLSPSTTGVLFFGDGPYVFSPGIDVSKLLIFTPLIHKSSTYSFEYFIKVKSVRVDGKNLPLNISTLLTMFSTVNQYSVLESSVYKHLARGFIEAANATRVAPVSPFDVCFSTAQNVSGDLTRPAMPILDLILQNEKVFWRIFENNSMVPVGNDTTCLGFLDGGPSPGASIIIGGYQLEDNLLQFDLVSSRLGFTSSLLLQQTDCASFNWH